MREYLIHDNYSRPFKVVIRDDNIAAIYKGKYLGQNKMDYSERLLEFSYRQVWIGNDSAYDEDFSKGNSILFELYYDSDGDWYTYMHVGAQVKTFLCHKVIGFYSPIGNNDVVYPYAETDLQYFLICENVRVSTKSVGDLNPYDYYYNHQDVKQYGMTVLYERNLR